MQKIKSEKGITLVILIVTVIVLQLFMKYVTMVATVKTYAN